MKIININIGKHGSDPNLVYVKVETDDGEFVVKGEFASIHINELVASNKISINGIPFDRLRTCRALGTN